MNIYENIVILNASPADEELESSTNKIKELITASGGEILKVDVWGRRKLANEIKKQKKGFYVLFTFSAPSSLTRKLEDYYKVFDPVIKYMIIRLEKKQSAHVLAGLNSLQKGDSPSRPTPGGASQVGGSTEQTATH
jgi:small subunit ribosomal protein S6